MAESICLSPRFAVEEFHGEGARKVRIVEDIRASGANSVPPTRDTAVTDSLDSILALEAYCRLRSPMVALRGASTDFRHAYKTIGLAPGQERFASVFLAPPQGRCLCRTCRHNPSGARVRRGTWAASPIVSMDSIYVFQAPPTDLCG